MNVSLRIAFPFVLVAFAGLAFFRSDLLIPAAAAVLVISLGLLGSLTGYVAILFALLFSLPVSVNVALGTTGASIRLPSEAFLLVAAVAFLVRKIFLERVDTAFLRHPVTVALLALTGIQLCTALATTMPLVSAKAMVVRLLYILVFYFALGELFRKSPRQITFLFAAYILALAAVAVYTLWRHSHFGFSRSYSGTAPEPFFADHTIFSACLVFCLSFVMLFVFRASSLFGSRTWAPLFLIVACLFGCAIFFAASRAAWLSLAVMAATAAVLYFRMPTVLIVCFLAGLTLYAVYNRSAIDQFVRTNRSDSRAQAADLATQARSIANITSDNSNAERINRWKCALRMAAEKPYTGYGPGTYQFQYLAFQKPGELTAISVTSPYDAIKGRGGSAHSEFLLVLSESGIPAFAAWLLLCALVVQRAASVNRRVRDAGQKALLFAAYAGWISFVCHSLFNNFLDTDKAAFLFFSTMALIVRADLACGAPGSRSS